MLNRNQVKTLLSQPKKRGSWFHRTTKLQEVNEYNADETLLAMRKVGDAEIKAKRKARKARRTARKRQRSI